MADSWMSTIALKHFSRGQGEEGEGVGGSLVAHQFVQDQATQRREVNVQKRCEVKVHAPFAYHCGSDFTV